MIEQGRAAVTPAMERESADVAGAGASVWLLPAIALGTMLAPLNSTMIAIALPEIQRDFGVSVTATTWLVTIYLVAMAVGQPIGGWLGDAAGRRRVYLMGLAWFAVASAGCAFAPNLPLLILFRTQQALAGAMSFPNGAAMVREAVPGERRATAFGIIGVATGLAAASGPPLGGLLVHLGGWSAIFWANVPVVGLSLLLGWRGLPRTRHARARTGRFDWIGSLLFAAALSAVIAIPTLIKLHRPVLAIAAGACGVLLGWAFSRWELRFASPVIDLRLFARSHFAAACASIGLANLVMYTTLLALPLYLEQVRGEGVRVAGLTLAAMSALTALLGPFGGRWADRRGRWLPAVSGALGLAAGVAVLALAVRGTSLTLIASALALMGIGLGIAGAAVQTAAVEAVPAKRTGSAAGIYSTARYLGSVAGSTALAIIFVEPPRPDQATPFVALFAGLVLVALLGVLANDRIAARTHAGASGAVAGASINASTSTD